MSALRGRLGRLESSQPSASLREAKAVLADLGRGLAAVLERIDGREVTYVPGPALVRVARSRAAGGSLLGRLAQALTTQTEES